MVGVHGDEDKLPKRPGEVNLPKDPHETTVPGVEDWADMRAPRPASDITAGPTNPFPDHALIASLAKEAPREFPGPEDGFLEALDGLVPDHTITDVTDPVHPTKEIKR